MFFISASGGHGDGGQGWEEVVGDGYYIMLDLV